MEVDAVRNMSRKGVVCPECGERAEIKRGDYKFTESGLKNVILSGIEIIHCPKCGDSPIIPAMSQLMRVMAVAVAAKPWPLTGEEVRFLRKFVGKTQDQFAELMRVDKTTISKWENNEYTIGDQSDMLIRVVAIGLGGLRKKELNEVIENFRVIHQGPAPGPMRVDVEAGTAEYAAA